MFLLFVKSCNFRLLQSLEAELPLDPDFQRDSLLQKIESELSNEKILPEDIQRIKYYVDVSQPF